jgi:uncharacterized protein (TIGR00369 family)
MHGDLGREFPALVWHPGPTAKWASLSGAEAPLQTQGLFPHMSKSVPDGFQPHFKKSRVTDPWEPLYSRVLAEAVQIGLWLSEAHCNSRGFVHGGVIAALADNAMGLSYGQAARSAASPDRPAPKSAVTVSLNIDYAATANVGQWLQIEPRVIKAGRTMGFVDALITADGAAIARASATFRAT